MPVRVPTMCQIDLFANYLYTIEKARNTQYPIKTITNDLVLLAYIPAQAKSLLYNLE